MNNVEEVPHWKKYPIIVNGTVVGYLNASLVEKQRLSDFDIKSVIALHVLLFAEYAAMEDTDDPRELRRISGVISMIEYEQQRFWGFTQDRRFHNWYRVPKCTCPKVDNMERRGTDYQIINEDCPVHAGGLISTIVLSGKDYKRLSEQPKEELVISI